MDLRFLKNNCLAKANIKIHKSFPPAKAGGNSKAGSNSKNNFMNRNTALAYS